MRTSIAAFALFRRAAPAGHVEFLAQWNEGWHAFRFVGGHKRENETFRDCCVREVSEELRLAERSDFRVSFERRSHLRYIHWSERAQTDTSYTVELFDAELLSYATADVEATASIAGPTETTAALTARLEDRSDAANVQRESRSGRSSCHSRALPFLLRSTDLGQATSTPRHIERLRRISR